MNQLTLDAALAGRARDAGIALVVEAADRRDGGWRDRMLEAVHRTAVAHPEFICDAVWLHASPEDRAFEKPKALGAVMLTAARLGWIEKTNRMHNSARVSAHRNPRAVWRSRLWRAA